MKKLQISLFGRPSLTADGDTVKISNRKALALLAYLALQPRPQGRELLAALLWPDYEPTRALANLRRTLWLLNQTPLSDHLHTTVNSIQLQPGKTVQVDVHRFQDTAGDLDLPLSSERAARFRSILEGIEGDFLADFYLPDSEPFESWAVPLREQLRQQVLNAMHALTQFALDSGDYSLAQTFAWRQLDLDNLREGAYRQLMQALARSGQRSAALAQYDTMRQLLDTELGVAPEAATRELYESIRQGELSQGHGETEPAASPQDSRSELTVFMFTDIEGSTPLWDRHREAMLDAFLQHNRLIVEQVRISGGRILEDRGDGFLVVFEKGDPLQAAIGIQRAFKMADWGVIEELRVRVGMHGTSADWEGYDFFKEGESYYGPLLNHAARVMDACWGGQILATDIVQEHFSLPEGAGWLDFGEHTLKGAEEPVRLYGLSHPDLSPHEFEGPRLAETDPPAHKQGAKMLPASPYRGLFAFREEDADYFFGRESFSELLLDTVQSRSMVAVVGPSGSGKSSVVQAGLLAELRKAGSWLITSFRPGSRPFQSLAGALIAHLEPDLSETDRLVETNKLAEALHQGELALMDVVNRILENESAETRFPLVADQFEELYTLVPEADLRDRFMDVLTEAVFDQYYRSEPRFSLVLTLRADFLGQALAHRPFADAIQESDVKLGPMTQAELERAIVNPARLMKVEFEPGLPPRILEDVGDEPGNLPLLEFALAMLWERRDAGLMTHAAYESIERVNGALARHADSVYEELEPDEQEQARRVFTQVVRPGEGTEDTRRLALRSELDRADWPLVRRLADARLLVTGRDSAGQDTVEVVHEALIRGWGRLRAWMEADREFRIWQERLRAALRSWESTERDEGGLLRGVSLATAENWLELRPADISTVEAEFIAGSAALRDRQVREREHRRRRIQFSLIAGLVLALLLAALAGLGWNSATAARQEAERSAAVSQSLALAANAVQVFESGDRDLALALALEAAQIPDPPLEAERALIRIANAPGTRLVLDGHTDSVTAMAFLPDGSRLLSGGGRDFGTMSAVPINASEMPRAADNSLRLWDLESGEALMQLEGHTDSVLDIAVSSDGRTAVSASADGSLIVWDLERGEMLRRFEGHAGEVSHVFIDPTGTRALSLSNIYRGEVKIETNLIGWDIRTGEELYRLEHAGKRIESIDLMPDGSFALFALNECGQTGCLSAPELQLFDVAEGRVVRLIELDAPDDSGVLGLAISPDGDFAVAQVNEFNPENFEPLFEPIGLRIDLPSGDVIEVQPISEALSFLQFSSDGTQIAGVSFFGPTISSAPIEFLDQTQVFNNAGVIRHNSGVSEYVFSPDGKRILSGGQDGALILWGVDSGQALLRLTGHTGIVTGLAFTPDGREAVSASMDGTLRVWQMEEGGLQTPQRMDAHESSNLVYAEFTPDGKFVFSVGGASPTPELSKEAVLWDWRMDQVLYVRALLEGFSPHFGVIHPDGETAIIGGWTELNAVDDRQGTLLEWDLLEGRMLRRVDLEEAVEFWHLAFSPDGETFLTGSADGLLRLWETEDLSFVRGFRQAGENDGDIFGVAFSPDGLSGLATSTAGIVNRWDLESGERLNQYDHGGWTTSITFSPDGTRFLSTSTDGDLVLWDFESGGEILRLLGHSNGPSSAVFLPDAEQAISSAADGTLILWDLQTGEALRSFEEHSAWVWRVDLSPDGAFVVSAAQDGLVILRPVSGLPMEDLFGIVGQYRFIPAFTCEQREQFRIAPLCVEE